MLLEIANIPKSTYFYVIKHLNYKSDKDKEMKELILKIFNDNYSKYGVPRKTQELRNMCMLSTSLVWT